VRTRRVVGNLIGSSVVGHRGRTNCQQLLA
jgi:hypothetical protein